MVTIKMTTIDGVEVDVVPESMGHRWDDVFPFRMITFFYGGHILHSMTEAEHIAEMFITTMKLSFRAGNGSLFSFEEVSQMQEAEYHYGYSSVMDGLSRSEWNKVPADQQAGFQERLAVVAMVTLLQMTLRRDFAEIPPPSSNDYDPVLHAGVLAQRRYEISNDGEQLVERDAFGQVKNTWSSQVAEVRR